MHAVPARSEGLEEFENPTATLAERDVADAETRLGSFLDQHILGRPAPARDRLTVMQPPALAPVASPHRSHRSRRVSSLSFAPGWAVAAGLVVAGGLLLLRAGRSDDQAVVLREQPGSRSGVAARHRTRLESPRQEPDGNWMVRWSPVPGADAYQVRLYGPDLQSPKILPLTHDPSVRLTPTDLEVANGSRFAFVEVRALQRGDAIGTSRIVPLRR